MKKFIKNIEAYIVMTLIVIMLITCSAMLIFNIGNMAIVNILIVSTMLVTAYTVFYIVRLLVDNRRENKERHIAIVHQVQDIFSEMAKDASYKDVIYIAVKSENKGKITEILRDFIGEYEVYTKSSKYYKYLIFDCREALKELKYL